MTPGPSFYDDTSSDFLRIEEELDVFDIKPQGVPIWERIRFNLYRKIKKEVTSTGPAHTSTEFNSSAYLRGFNLWLKNAVIKNPFLAGQHDFLFYGHERRKLLEDDRWWDIYCDPITEAGDIDYLHVEKPYLMDHKSPVKTENIRYLDFIWYSGAIRRNLGMSDITVSGQEKKQLEEVSRAIEQQFGVDINLVDRAEIKLTRRDSTLDLFKRFLSRVDPKVVIVVVSYGKHTFLEACHDLGIPTVELQHGVIHNDHMGYTYPGHRTKLTFPDYLLVWGKYWRGATEYPIPEERVITVGYPYLEQTREQYEEAQSKDQILFISQGTIGEQLSKFAVEIDDHGDIEHDLVYKLHPGEYDRWQEEYPWLVEANFEIIDSPEPPLYELFAESTVQVGVGSTAVYEGLCFDLETYLYDCSGSSGLEELVEEGAAEPISSVEELVSLLGTREVAFDREYYFEQDAIEKTRQTLQRIAEEGEYSPKAHLQEYR